MKKKSHHKHFEKDHIWLGLIAIGPLTAYAAIFNPALSILAMIFIFMAVKGITDDIMWPPTACQ